MEATNPAPTPKCPTLGAPGAGGEIPIQHLERRMLRGGARRNSGPEGAQNILLSLAELPFMKMKLRMMVRRPSLAVWLSLRRGEQRHPPEGGTWGALSPFPPLQKTPGGCQRPHRQPLTASGSPPRPVAGCWSGCRCGVWCRSPPAAAQTPAGGKDLIQWVQGGVGIPTPNPTATREPPATCCRILPAWLTISE